MARGIAGSAGSRGAGRIRGQAAATPAIAARGTSYDVARLAGVSQSAVSRCFREGGSVSPKTRAKVMAAAKQLGYRPNAIARGLITRRSNMVAVVISSLTNLHYPEVLAELTRRLSERDIRVLLFTLDRESDIDNVIDQIWRYQVDGAIVAARLTREQVESFGAARVPLVLYNRRLEDVPVSVVMCDSGPGETMLVDRVVGGGARRVAIIGGPEDSTVGEARLRGALDRLAYAGITDVPIVRGNFSYESGRVAALDLLGRGPLDAIIAANDVMAIGAMDAARLELGIAVPEQLSIVGFDGVDPARWASYRLTTVRQPVGRMTEAAIAMLVERINSPDIGPERRFFSGEFVAGQSARLG